MTFKELDKLVYTSLKNRWGKKAERRDYRKMEKKKPDFYKGMGRKNGLMFLVDVTDDLYVDINLFEFEDYFTMEFRKDDHKLIEIDSRKFNKNEDFLGTFFILIDEYLYLEQRFKLINSGLIPKDILRTSKIDSILS